MLHPQIPNSFKGVGAEVKAKLPGLEAKIMSQEEVETTISKLEELRSYIERKYDIGTIEYPGEWVKQKVFVKHISPKANSKLFALVGKLPNDHYFLVGGSSHHIVGASQPTQFSTPTSYWPFLVNALVEDFNNLEHSGRFTNAGRDYKPENNHLELGCGVGRDELATIVAEMYNMKKQEEFEVEFLGRHLNTYYHQDRTSDFYAELGINHPKRSSFITPLYVRLVGHQYEDD